MSPDILRLGSPKHCLVIAKKLGIDVTGLQPTQIDKAIIDYADRTVPQYPEPPPGYRRVLNPPGATEVQNAIVRIIMMGK